MPDAAEPSAAGADMRLQHRPHARPKPQVGMADDAGADLRLAVATRGAHRRDAIDELGLADRPHLLRPARAMHRAALHEHRGDDVVATVGVGQQIVEHVAPARPFPQMMVRIDDRQLGLEDRLGPPREPVVAHRQIGAAGRLRGRAHGGSLPIGVGDHPATMRHAASGALTSQSPRSLKPGMIVGTAAERPVIFALALRDRQIVDAGDAPPHQPVLVELPVLVAVAAEPVAAVVVPLIGEAHGDAVVAERPELLDQAVVELAVPFARQKRLDGRAALQELRAVAPAAVRRYRPARRAPDRACSTHPRPCAPSARRSRR